MIKHDNPLWYKDAVIYEVYVRAFYDSNSDGHGDLSGLTAKLDYLRDLGIDCIWLLPIYSSPLKDDGYDIADYYSVQPDYGTLEDFKDLTEQAHQRGIRIIADLVLNHTSDQHPWFQAARQSRSSKYRDYYVWSDTNRKYKDARIIFIDTETSNWTWDDTAGQYYWHRFYSSQPDLNFNNPTVQEEMFNVMKFWLDLGIDGFRVDAVPYLFEREGTICENLPETHDYLKRVRKFIDTKYPGRILLCEANQWPEDVRPYFGDGDEFHMGFHFPIMPRIFMAMKKGNVKDLISIINRTPLLPECCQWCTFLRNHDELTLEMVTEEERQWMWQEYAPESRMRLNLGIRRRLAPLLDGDQRKIELANSILFTLTGTPIIYYGDEIGMGDNIWLEDRSGVRTPMQWENSPDVGFSSASPKNFYLPVIDDPIFGPEHINVRDQQNYPSSLLNQIKKMIAVHKTYKAFGRGNFSWVDMDNDAIAAYYRTYLDERILVIQNLSAIPQEVEIYLDTRDSPQDILNQKNYQLKNKNHFSSRLSGYEYIWMKL